MRSCRSSILILLTLGLCMALPSARGGDEGASSAADAAGTFADQGEDGRRVYHTHRTTDPPEIDGRLDDAVWELVPWSGEFVQRSPDEGDAPTGQTRFKILYDDANIYVAYRAYDPEPARIGNVLDRRDYFPGDWVEINIDSYHDLRTAF